MFPFWIDFTTTPLAQMMSVVAVIAVWVMAMLTCRPCGR
jgi:hypothetical protein